MKQSIDNHAEKKRKSQDVFEEHQAYGPEQMYMVNNDCEEIPSSSMPPPKYIKNTSFKMKKWKGIFNYFIPRTTPGA